MLGGWLWKLIARLGMPARIAGKSDTDALYIYGPGAQFSTVLITCFGIAGSDLPAIIASVEKKLRSFDKRIYFTDTPDFSAFLKIGALFEYFPPAEDRDKYLAGAPWGAYLRARYDRLTIKWRPSIVVSYGIPVDQFLAGAADRTVRGA